MKSNEIARLRGFLPGYPKAFLPSPHPIIGRNIATELPRENDWQTSSEKHSHRLFRGVPLSRRALPNAAASKPRNIDPVSSRTVAGQTSTESRQRTTTAVRIREKTESSFQMLPSPIAAAAHKVAESGPQIVCICGSTRFREEITEANQQLTLAGVIVVAPTLFQHSGDTITAEQKQTLDELHLKKIDLADAVLVVDPGGYIGESTTREIAYAESTGKPVFRLSSAENTAQPTPQC